MQKENLKFRLDYSPKVFVVWEREGEKITYFNEKARELYGISEEMKETFTERMSNIMDSFPVFMNNLETSQEQTQFYPEISTKKVDGEEQMGDLLVGFWNNEKTQFYLEFMPKLDNRELFLKNLVDQACKPMFLASLDEGLKVFYGNDLFFRTFAKNEEEFTSFYHSNFIETVVDIEKESFMKEIRRTLSNHSEFHQDIQISTVSGGKKWFYLELEYRPLGKGKGTIKGMMLPISDRVEVEKQLDHMSRYLEAIQELTSGALYYVDVTNKVAVHHSKMLKKAGFPEKMDQFPHCMTPMLHQEDKPLFLEYANKIMEGKKETCRVRYQKGRDCWGWAELSSMPVLDGDGNLLEVIGKVQNIEEEIRLLERATIDPLTGAYNKEAVEKKVMDTLEHSENEDVYHAFCFLDMDRFKYVNDNLGHKFGDFLLAEFGKRMRSVLGPQDIFGRVGGDEFIILLREVPKFSLLMTKAQEILDLVGEEFDDGQQKHSIGASIGISVFPEHGKDFEDLYFYADLALYRSKERGKNMATVYNPPRIKEEDMENHQ